MKRINYAWKRFIFVLTLFLLSSFSLALAQGVDAEPNNACTEAQDMGPITLPFIVDGSLDTPPEIPDVDFFEFIGQPGTLVRVDYEGQDRNKGTLPDPFLGLFDSNCNLLEVNDDTGTLNDDTGTLNSRLQFAIPEDGIFILAATSCCDVSFIGEGGSSGTYQITIAPPPPSIGSVSGRVIDAVTGLPLRGDVSPFASANLLRCSDGDCFEYVGFQATDSEGQFQFTLDDFNGNPLEVGTYQVQASANDFESGQTDLFDVGEGEDLNVGDLSLQPPIIKFSEIRSCGDLPSEGGRCRYSVRITNTSLTPIAGAAWSLVDSHEIGSPLDFTNFQAGTRDGVRLDPGESEVLQFRFKVPDTVQDGASICPLIFFGEDPDPFFNTLGQRFLFCIIKGSGGDFSVMDEKESQELFRKLTGQSPMPNKAK